MPGSTGSPVSAAIHALTKAMRDSHQHHRTTTADAYAVQAAPHSGSQPAPLDSSTGRGAA